MALLDKIGHVLTADITKDFKLKKKNIEMDTPVSFVEHLKKRRSIAELIQESVRCCPSAYNSQSTRIVVLFGDSHQQFWDIVKEVQRKNVAAHIFEGAALKVDQCADAFGTVLFYEDQQVIQQLQKKVPFSAEDFPVWSEQTSGMAQFAVWTSIADAGMGASLQHYNPHIDQAIANFLGINEHWLLRAQLVFGSVEGNAPEREEPEDQERFRIYT